MTLIFFQNCISPHQIPYIKELSNLNNIEHVYLISPRINYNFRSDMGWNTDKFMSIKEIKFLIAPKISEVEALLNNDHIDNCHCIFSGISAFHEILKWFKLTLKYNVKRSIITEPPFLYNKPLWLHFMRFFLKDYKYIKYISNVFVIGESYLWYYQMWSKSWNIISFIYCTEIIKRQLPPPKDNKIKLLYVGSLSKRKNVQLLIRAVKNIDNVQVAIIGDGDQRSKLEQLADNNTTFYGNLSMTEVAKSMQKYDVLVLPSLYDGWGAVINEALSLGLFVICSDTCGAKSLLKDEKNGIVFRSNDQFSLQEAIIKCKNDLTCIRESINYRIEWSNSNISGKVMAQYFIKNLK